MTVADWLQRWSVPPAAAAELAAILDEGTPTNAPNVNDYSEAAVQGRIRLSRLTTSWRNNVGVLPDRTGTPVRFGLANDSSKLNARCKSSDLIGITAHRVIPADVGRLLGIFTAIETKRGNWEYKGTGREVAQWHYLTLVNKLGGLGMFATSLEGFEAAVTQYTTGGGVRVNS